MTYRFLIIVLGWLWFHTIPLHAAEEPPSTIFQQYRPYLCHVTYYQNVAMHAKIGSYMKIKQHRNGIIVNASGLIMVSSDVYPLSLDIMTGGASYFSGEPTDFKITLSNGKQFDAHFVGKDDRVGVAFLQLALPKDTTLTPVEFTTDTLPVGASVLILELLTARYQFQPSLRHLSINARIDKPNLRYVILDAEPQLSSCGLVILPEGKAVGITRGPSLDNALLSESMDDYDIRAIEIIPATQFLPLIQKPPVLTHQHFQGRSWLGIVMQALTPELKAIWKVPAEGGVVINRVYEQSPAEKAKLQPGDIIIALNGKPLLITRDDDLDIFRNRILQIPPGTTITVTIFRKGKTLTRRVTLQAAPRSIDLAERYQSPELGFEVRELTPGILYENQLPLNTTGVYVYRVDRASPAGIGGLDIGQIIQKVNNRPVESIAQFRNVFNEILQSNPRKIMFYVRDGQNTQFVFITPR